ncbi:hypothetical protein G7054_g12047 [Neopestalotiopsis clavispora]|nr:hypothetical protein G7054_g12047 [Neopestalotiopsis clavispora]
MDARNSLYEGRIALASTMIELDELEQRGSALVAACESSNTTSASDRTRSYVEDCNAKQQKAANRTTEIISTAEKLQQDIDQARKEIEQRKAAIVRRKADLASASQGIAARRNREFEETKTSIRKLKYHWDREHEATAQYRAALCAEVAKLYRLQRIKKGNPNRYEYKIGGLEVVDLHLLNTEITLPHNDYPRPTIFSLASSYHHGQVGFPGTSPLPIDSLDRQYGHIPHPRPLFLDKPLSSFSKEESNNYNSFLEGVCLLAYDIVWLCRTQGIPVGDNSNSFEDFTYMGRNLYNLLNGSSLQRNQPGQPIIDANTPSPTHASDGATAENDDITKSAPKMGLWSHGAAHTSLNSTTGQDFTRSFKLPTPIKLADKLKARLAQEAPVPEWELIEDDEFGPNDLDDGVLIGGTPQSRSRNPRFGLESYMSVNTVRSNGSQDARASLAAVNDTATRSREKSSNGWTKIKPR